MTFKKVEKREQQQFFLAALFNTDTEIETKLTYIREGTRREKKSRENAKV